MANKQIFASNTPSVNVPVVDTVNEAGGVAYKLTDKHALAQYILTGCLNATYYADARVQLDKVLELTKDVPAKFIAQLAVYAREKGLMKDSPALLCAVLAVRDVELLKSVFFRVIDNGKMLRNFAQIIRSDAVGRKSFGSAIKNIMQKWFDSRSDVQLFRDSIGNDPSLGDVIKMVHPTPANKTREALYGYLCGKKAVFRKSDMETIKLPDGRTRTVTVMVDELPAAVQAFEKYKKSVLDGGEKVEVPDVPFQLLTALNLGKHEWTEIAKNAPWQMTRMNLNTFLRQGVFENNEVTRVVAERLRNPVEVERSRCFPYQLLCAYKNAEGGVPTSIVNALHDAMEIATKNVPEIKGKVYIMVDVSGSMGSPVTGYRQGATTKVTCRDVAALMAASLLRRNKEAEVIPFHDEVVKGLRLNPHDSVMTNAEKLAKCPSGGTACGAPIRWLNERQEKGDLIIMISDNESWADMAAGSGRYGRWGGGTSAGYEWEVFRKRNPKARFVAIDIQPYGTAQVKEGSAVMNIGGFADTVFEIVSSFVVGELDQGHWVGEIEKIDVSAPSPTVQAAKAGVKKAMTKAKKPVKAKRDKNGRFRR